MRHLYYCDHIDHLHLAAGDEEAIDLPGFIDIKALTGKALKNVYEGFEGLVEPNLFQITNDALGQAVSVGVLQYGKPNPAFLAHMQKVNQWFSARKSVVQQKELARLLMSDDGKTKRSWKSFQKAAEPIVGNYNQTWLKTEYNTAIRAARMGSRWQAFEAGADLYPNLEYLPSRAATPRPEHKPYYHVIRKLDDEFWVKHYPPSDYNCLCGAEPTDSDVTPLPEEQPQPTPGLDHNPGLTEQVFSNTHPYTVNLKESKADLAAIDREGERLQREADYQRLRLHADFMKALNQTDKLQAAWPKVDHEELASIWAYTESEYYDLNRFLRAELIDKDEHYAALNRVLSAALKKVPAYKKDVYRGTTLPADILNEYKDHLKRGKPIQHKSFTSTSANPLKAFNEGVKMVIRSKTGRRIVKISKFASEDEVLFDAGTWFTVNKIEEIGQETWIHLTETKLKR
ncbi:ADP-ribosyltransferase [Spirosoma areae]